MRSVRRIPTSRIILALLSFAPVSAAERAAVDLPPVALHQEPPDIPAEASGSGAAPAVTVRVRIDARGKPVSVETLRVDPPGPFDAAFGGAIREAVLRWRFAPALRNGRAAETTLEWTVQFAALPVDGGPGPVSPAESPPLPRAVEETAVAARQRVADLPSAGRRALREGAARLAESHLEEGRRTRALTEHFEVITDSIAQGTGRRIGAQLESAFGVASRLFGDAIPEEPSPERIVTYVFAKHASFGAFATEDPRSLGSGGGGFYDPAGLLAFHLEIRGGEAALARVLLHEATRAFLHGHVARAGVTLPSWLEEGLAEYVAASGGEPRRAAGRRPLARTRGEPARADPATVGKAIRAGTAIPLDRLLDARREKLEGEDARLFSVESWMWVHFLRHGKPDWPAGAFPRLVLYLAEGFAPADVFPAVYAAGPADLAANFREYVKHF
jgi:TonB family protein